MLRASGIAAAGLLAVRAALPTNASAADLFPVDDWLGSGIKKAGEIVVGPLRLGAEELARLLVTLVGALADLLVPKSLVRAGVDGVRWLVQPPPIGLGVSGTGAVGAVRMPHLVELRGVLTWIGVTLMPLGIAISAGRAFLSPGVETESPAEVLQRALVAGLGLVLYDWVWGVLGRLSRLLTDALLGLPWVADGVERMLETLLIGGAAGTAVAAEFVIPLLILCAGAALFGLLVVRVGLEVVTALVYVLGGLALSASMTGLGRRLLSAWLVAAGAVLVLPVLWAVVFVTGAALMLDAGSAAGSGLAGFVAQLYNVVAALAVFALAIMLARGIFRHAGGAITALINAPASAGGGAAGGGAAAGRARALAANATPAGLARFSQRLRGGLAAGAAAGTRAVSFPARHPAVSARATTATARRPVQATRAGAQALRGALTGPGGAALADVARARAGRRVARAGAAPGGADVGARGSAGVGGEPPRIVGGRRARAAVRRDGARERRAIGTDWSTPRPVPRAVARPPARAARAVRYAGPRPWWLGRGWWTRRDDDRGGKGGGRGR